MTLAGHARRMAKGFPFASKHFNSDARRLNILWLRKFGRAGRNEEQFHLQRDCHLIAPVNTARVGPYTGPRSRRETRTKESTVEFQFEDLNSRRGFRRTLIVLV